MVAEDAGEGVFSGCAGETFSSVSTCATGGVAATGTLDETAFAVEVCAASSFSTLSWRLLISLSNSARSVSLIGGFPTGGFEPVAGPVSVVDGVEGLCVWATAAAGKQIT